MPDSVSEIAARLRGIADRHDRFELLRTQIELSDLRAILDENERLAKERDEAVGCLAPSQQKEPVSLAIMALRNSLGDMLDQNEAQATRISQLEQQLREARELVKAIAEL